MGGTHDDSKLQSITSRFNTFIFITERNFVPLLEWEDLRKENLFPLQINSRFSTSNTTAVTPLPKKGGGWGVADTELCC